MDRLVGYVPVWEVDAGERVAVHASGDGSSVDVDLVRLDGEDVMRPVPGTTVRVHAVPPVGLPLGSWASVALPWGAEEVVATWWMRRTLRLDAPTPVVGAVDPAGRGWVLEVDADDAWTLRTRDRAGRERIVELAPTSPLGQWTPVRLVVGPHGVSLDAGARSATTPMTGGVLPREGVTCSWVLARSPWRDDRSRSTYDGRITELELRWGSAGSAARGTGPAGPPDAAWSFEQDMHADRVPPATARTPPLQLHQGPTRAVTGPRWTGEVHHWTQDRRQWSAVHFHHDDLEDAGWPVVAEPRVPTSAPPGLYAARLRGGSSTDIVPFVVRSAPHGPPRPPLRVLLPTMTYLAYADEVPFEPHVAQHHGWWDEEAVRRGLLSAYNWHADGSGVSMVSTRRPLLNVRPDHLYWLTGAPHGLSVDLHLLRWLRRQGHDLEVITDHHLDRDPGAALAGARVLVTGSHPEYWTRRMMTALEDFLSTGGRLAYLGGNGLAAQVGVHGDREHLMELRRRGNGPGLWDAAPGELGLASTGEQGGYWRHHRPTPRSLTGLDSAGMGFVTGSAYTRAETSRHPALEWVFAGVPAPTFGLTSTVLGAAASYEVDRADARRGTPDDCHVLASATSFPSDYVGLDETGEVRADLVLRVPVRGGAVLGVGSVAWCGALDSDPDVARITDNVVRRFLDPTPLVRPSGAHEPAPPAG